MGNLMSCVLICGAMEVVHVVNANGSVEKLVRPMRTAELIWAHNLEPSSVSSCAGKQLNPPAEVEEDNSNKFVLLPLDLKTTKSSTTAAIADTGCRAYKLQCLSEENVDVAQEHKQRAKKSRHNQHPRQSNEHQPPSLSTSRVHGGNNAPFRVRKEGGVTTLVVSKKYLEQLLSDKELKTNTTANNTSDASRDHNSHRRSSRVRSRSSSTSGWRPGLESISEASGSHNQRHL